MCPRSVVQFCTVGISVEYTNKTTTTENETRLGHTVQCTPAIIHNVDIYLEMTYNCTDIYTQMYSKTHGPAQDLNFYQSFPGFEIL